jgi:hypothetical protein
VKHAQWLRKSGLEPGQYHRRFAAGQRFAAARRLNPHAAFVLTQTNRFTLPGSQDERGIRRQNDFLGRVPAANERSETHWGGSQSKRRPGSGTRPFRSGGRATDTEQCQRADLAKVSPSAALRIPASSKPRPTPAQVNTLPRAATER